MGFGDRLDIGMTRWGPRLATNNDAQSEDENRELENDPDFSRLRDAMNALSRHTALKRCPSPQLGSNDRLPSDSAPKRTS
jgi:hypothetical protein